MNVIMAITHVHLMLLVLTLREVIIALATLDILEMVKIAQVRENLMYFIINFDFYAVL